MQANSDKTLVAVLTALGAEDIPAIVDQPPLDIARDIAHMLAENDIAQPHRDTLVGLKRYYETPNPCGCPGYPREHTLACEQGWQVETITPLDAGTNCDNCGRDMVPGEKLAYYPDQLTVCLPCYDGYWD